jgi:O-methyltransferase
MLKRPPLSNEYLKGNTLVDMPRLKKLAEFIEETKNLRGIIAEVGVYRGGTAKWICDRTDRRVLLFDTFEGMPEVGPHDLHHKGDFADTSLSHISELLRHNNNYSAYKGVFPANNAQYAEHEQFVLVHLDVDIYQSVKECLEFFWPRMVAGGIIVLDDYNEPNCPGAKLAADEFSKHVIPTVQSQAIIVRGLLG